jgi:peptidoglycan-associated lipoprotein
MVKWTELVVSLLLAGFVGCSSTGGSGVEETPTPTGSEFEQGSVPRSGGATAPRPELTAIYFDFDRAEIRSDARPALRDNASAINGNDDWGVVTVEGHCDERGSEEYNLALGERRANNVKRYLTDLGVPSNRLRTVSFGEARPAVPGHDESAWRYNRRSEFKGGS